MHKLISVNHSSVTVRNISSNLKKNFLTFNSLIPVNRGLQEKIPVRWVFALWPSNGGGFTIPRNCRPIKRHYPLFRGAPWVRVVLNLWSRVVPYKLSGQTRPASPNSLRSWALLLFNCHRTPREPIHPQRPTSNTSPTNSLSIIYLSFSVAPFNQTSPSNRDHIAKPAVANLLSTLLLEMDGAFVYEKKTVLNTIWIVS